MKGPAIALGALAGLGLLAACFGLVFVEPVVTMAAAAAPAAAPGQPQPSGLPVVSGPAQPGNPLGPDCPHSPVSQPFGPSTLQLEPAAHGYAHFHTGVDLACPYGTLVRNVDVVGLAHVTSGCSGYGSCGGGFGNNVVVEATTPAGHFFIRYGHLAATAAKDGALVQVGELLGWEGSTGYSTGPHLHFEVDQGSPSVTNSIDPAGWLVL
jgi:murein DD-endopeptidase MepM/ murein hydrolase activator NlpD